MLYYVKYTNYAAGMPMPGVLPMDAVLAALAEKMGHAIMQCNIYIYIYTLYNIDMIQHNMIYCNREDGP